MWKKLNTSYVRPQLEFAIPVFGKSSTQGHKNRTKYKESKLWR